MIIRHGITLAALFVVTTATIFSTATVVPCTVNKIAPHQQSYNQNKRSPRTFGNIVPVYSEETHLEVSDFGQAGNDCFGYQQQFVIDDKPNQINPQSQEKFFGNWFQNVFWGPQNSPQNPQLPATTTLRPPNFYPNPVTTERPVVTNRPKPTRPPKRPPQGGYFGNNYYNPPNYFYPSDNFKPVYENAQEMYHQPSYYPAVVGGNVNQIVGVNAGTVPQRPGRRMGFSNSNRPRDGIIGSFVDLLFE